MKILRAILKWGLRGILLIAAVLLICWGVVRVSRAHYRGLALQGSAAFIVENAPVIALTHARVIDGNGTPALNDQSLILRDGMIAAYGAADAIAVPPGARVLNLLGKTVMPGLVMMHEHLFTIAQGKQADLVVIDGDPSARIADVRNVEIVFRKGVGYSSEKLFGAVRGLVGVQ